MSCEVDMAECQRNASVFNKGTAAAHLAVGALLAVGPVHARP